MSTQVLGQFVPLSELTQENLHDLASKTRIEKMPKGGRLFHKGDTDNYSYYLLSGEVILLSDDHKQTRIIGGTAPTRYPLDHHRPRISTAIADSEISFFRIDNDLLDILLTWDQNAGYLVAEIDTEIGDEADNGDWMTTMLRSEIFHRIPPSNIQQVFMCMESVRYRRGERVINQGDDGDYYYFIKSGRVLVTHHTKSGKEIKLAQLDAGHGFGEEALISDYKRNANVTMLSDGVLMRMAKEDFVQLLKSPTLHSVDYQQGSQMVERQGTLWLDVRLESEYKNVHIPGAVNIPLYLLRIKMAALDKDKHYIVYCDTGRRSASATYLLNERGYQASCLNGGLRALEKPQLAGLKRGSKN